MNTDQINIPGATSEESALIVDHLKGEARQDLVTEQDVASIRIFARRRF